MTTPVSLFLSSVGTALRNTAAGVPDRGPGPGSTTGGQPPVAPLEVRPRQTSLLPAAAPPQLLLTSDMSCDATQFALCLPTARRTLEQMAAGRRAGRGLWCSADRHTPGPRSHSPSHGPRLTPRQFRRGRRKLVALIAGRKRPLAVRLALRKGSLELAQVTTEFEPHCGVVPSGSLCGGAITSAILAALSAHIERVVDCSGLGAGALAELLRSIAHAHSSVMDDVATIAHFLDVLSWWRPPSTMRDIEAMSCAVSVGPTCRGTFVLRRSKPSGGRCKRNGHEFSVRWAKLGWFGGRLPLRYQSARSVPSSTQGTSRCRCADAERPRRGGA